MSILVLDQFTDTAGTRLASHTIGPTNTPGTAWTENQGSWEINPSGKATADLGGDSGINSLATCNPAVSDTTLKVDCVCPNSNNYALGLCARLSDASNYLSAQIERDSGGTAYLLLRKTVAGSNTTLGTGNFSVDPTNSTVTITLVMSSSSLTLNATNATTVTATDSFNSTQTKHGLKSYSDGTYSVGQLKNFQVGTGGGKLFEAPDLALGVGGPFFVHPLGG